MRVRLVLLHLVVDAGERRKRAWGDGILLHVRRRRLVQVMEAMVLVQRERLRGWRRAMRRLSLRDSWWLRCRLAFAHWRSVCDHVQECSRVRTGHRQVDAESVATWGIARSGAGREAGPKAVRVKRLRLGQRALWPRLRVRVQV